MTPDSADSPSYRPYPAYKSSGVEWLGEIPEHWSSRKLKYVSSVSFSSVDKHATEGETPVRLCNYTDVYNNEFITSDMDFMEATAAVDEIFEFSLQKGDVLVTKDSETWEDIAVAALVMSEMPGVVCGYHLALIRARTGVAEGGYLFRAIRASGVNDQFMVEANGVTRFGLGKLALQSGLIPLPTKPEQLAIAAFLDRETARIDALEAKKERLIELLLEKRKALTSAVVTGKIGIKPNGSTFIPDPSSLRDSGVEWLGKIPKRWEVVQLRRVVAKFVDYRGATPDKATSGVPLVTARNIKNGAIDFTQSDEYIREEDYAAWMVRGLPKHGDVLMTTEAPLGESAQVMDEHIALAQRVMLFKVAKERLTNDYLKCYFAALAGRAELWSRATGSTAIGIKASHLREILICVPPTDEQWRISALIDREKAKIDALVAKIRESVEKLKEYRTALISAAVTGKIDVREDKGERVKAKGGRDKGERIAQH